MCRGAASPPSPPPTRTVRRARPALVDSPRTQRSPPASCRSGWRPSPSSSSRAIAAPDALGHTSWSFVLPDATVLAIAALGQMLVVMHGGIDLSTPGVDLGRRQPDRRRRRRLGPPAPASRSSPLSASASLVGLVNGILVGLLRLNPLIVTLAVGQIVLAWSSKYSRDVVTNQPERAERAVVVGDREAARSQQRLLDGRGAHDRRRARPPLHDGRPPVPGGGREPEGGVDRGAPRSDARRARLHRGRRALRGRRGPARRRRA